MSEVKSCERCLLPDFVPGIHLGEDGLCQQCRSTEDVSTLAAKRETLGSELKALIDARRGAQPYEVVVAFSGGKDSSFTLKYLAGDLNLRCLAITIDNGFVSDGAFANCRSVTTALGVDHMIFAPNRRFTERMYRVSAEDVSVHPPAALLRASAICASCISLINTHVLQKAMEVRAPLIAGGYLAGQLPRGGAIMEFRLGAQARLRQPMVERFVKAFGEEARAYFELRIEGGEGSIAVINPMLAIEISEADILTALEPLGWVKPADTGATSTNCRLNDLGVYLHSKRHGFHPYAFEIAEQLRHGLISKEHAERKLKNLPSQDSVRWLADRIQLDIDAT
jgi:tRNA(Ile)-lysidine synthase TilS/MesJ